MIPERQPNSGEYPMICFHTTPTSLNSIPEFLLDEVGRPNNHLGFPMNYSFCMVCGLELPLVPISKHSLNMHLWFLNLGKYWHVRTTTVVTCLNPEYFVRTQMMFCKQLSTVPNSRKLKQHSCHQPFYLLMIQVLNILSFRQGPDTCVANTHKQKWAGFKQWMHIT